MRGQRFIDSEALIACATTQNLSPDGVVGPLLPMTFPVRPWMSDNEVAAIEEVLQPGWRVLEWGAGASTLHFSKQVSLWHSVEHNITWYRSVAMQLHESNIANAYVHCVPVDGRAVLRGDYPPDYKERFRSYVEFPLSLGIAFDAALIDGRARLFCAQEAVRNLVHPRGILFFHDFFSPHRERYKRILDDCELVDEVTNGQTLAILRARPDILLLRVTEVLMH